MKKAILILLFLICIYGLISKHKPKTDLTYVSSTPKINLEYDVNFKKIVNEATKYKDVIKNTTTIFKRFGDIGEKVLNDLRGYTDLTKDDIKKKAPQYIYSNIQYNRCKRSSDNYTEREFTTDDFDQNYYLLLHEHLSLYQV